MRRLLALLFSIIASTFLFAQEIQIVSFEPTLDLSAKLNPVFDSNGQACALLRVNLPTDDAFFEGNIVGTPARDHNDWLVYVPEGTRFLRISVKGNNSFNYDFPTPVEAFRTYELSVFIKEPVEKRVGNGFMIPALGFYWPNSDKIPWSSYSVMFGYVNRFGGYVRLKTDFNPYIDIKSAKICNANGRVTEGEDDYTVWHSYITQKSRFAVTSGALYHLAKPVYFYVGAGYGRRTFAWKDFNDDNCIVASNSFLGLETEAGLMVRFSFFVLSIGVQTNSFKYSEANFGLGLIF